MRTKNREIVSALIFSKDGKLFQGMKAEKKGGVYRIVGTYQVVEWTKEKTNELFKRIGYLK
jgi:ClpP class serine protease